MELRDIQAVIKRQAQHKWVLYIDAEVLDLLGKTPDFDNESKSGLSWTN